MTTAVGPFRPDPRRLTIRGVTYRTTAAYSYIAEEDRAVAALRGDLRTAADRDGVVPDWSTLHVTGPTQVIGARGVFWYEWAATVDTRNGSGHYL